MFDTIAKSFANDPDATYDTSTSTTFNELFSCAVSDDDILQVTHAVWQGFVEYSQTNVTIEITDDGNGVVEVSDLWGKRCENPDSLVQCELPNTYYQECDGGSCTPKSLSLLKYPLHDLFHGELDIPILEPCNFASNLAYYRVMPQLCGPHFYMDGAASTAFQHSFGNLAAGSSLWHASHTYLGYQADNQLISVVSFLVHQLIIGALADANNLAHDAPEVLELMNLQATARSKTAVESSEYVSEIFTTRYVSEWATELENLDVPEYETTFAVIFASALTVIFPDGQSTVSSLINTLADVVGVDAGEIDRYLPALQTLTSNLNLTNDKKFVLFRQLVGMLSKIVFAFLWQEQVIEVPFFKEASTNRAAPDIMPPLVSLFNFISGFEHVDDDFQEFRGMYPGDEECRKTQPHAKWHELSAQGLLDMVYLSDCLGAVVTGSDDLGCAHLENIDGLGHISRHQLNQWTEETFPSIPIIENIIPLIVAAPFALADANGDDTVDWSDIESIIDTVGNVVEDITTFIENFMAVFADYCIQDSDCGSGQFCNILQLECQNKKDDYFSPCLKDSQCLSGTCGLITRACGLECNTDSDCSSDQWCSYFRTPDMCRPLMENGKTCLDDRECYSGRCDSSWTCKATLSSGSRCWEDSDCSSDRCEFHWNWFKSWWKCK